MQKEIEITIAPEDVNNQQIVRSKLSIALNIDIVKINNHKILKRSIDARSRKVIYRLQVRAYIDEDIPQQEDAFSYPIIGDAKTVIIVGAGPAGLRVVQVLHRIARDWFPARAIPACCPNRCRSRPPAAPPRPRARPCRDGPCRGARPARSGWVGRTPSAAR